MDTGTIVNTVLNDIAKDFKSKLNRLLANCESPIEGLFLANMIHHLIEYPDFTFEFIVDYIFPEVGNEDKYKTTIQYDDRNGNRIAITGIKFSCDSIEYKIYPQHNVFIKDQLYRADIAVLFTRINLPGENPSVSKKICIECDGHEFHEKTKNQVIKDNIRYRAFASNGWQCLRYSGSEIHSVSDFQKFKKIMHEISTICLANWKFKPTHKLHDIQK